MPTVAGHGECAHTLWDAFNRHAGERGLGKALIEQTFVLSYSPGWVTGSRIPDVMYYAAERLEAYKAANPDWKLKPYALVPDLVAEVVSPTDDLGDLDEKINRYLLDGVRAVWAIDFQREKVSLYTLVARQPFTKQQADYKVGDMLSGGEIIPGFEIAVASLFE